MGLGAPPKATKIRELKFTVGIRCILFTFASVLAGALAGCNFAPDVPLAPRETIFGAPERVQLRLSPDGQMMSFLSSAGGTTNIWVAPFGEMESARQLTFEPEGELFRYQWAANSRTILYRRAGTTSGEVHVIAVDAETGQETDLTPMPGARAEVLAVTPARPDEIVLGIAERDPAWQDLYIANLETGDLTLIEENNQFTVFAIDHDLHPRFAIAPQPGGRRLLFQKTDDGWQSTADISSADAMTFEILGFDETNKRVYFTDSRGRDTSALTRYTPSTGETEILGQGENADIDRVLQHPTTHLVQAFTLEHVRREWRVIDPAVEADLKFLSAFAGPTGVFEILDRTLDDKTWVIYLNKPTEPGAYYLYAPATQTLTKQFETRPDLPADSLAPLHSAIIKARDGLDLIVYYTLPDAADKNGDGTAETARPLVVKVHGGPWRRDLYRRNPMHQWLANRGYAVLSVNYRGSTGLGKDFINAADGEWGDNIINDIEDATRWAVAEGIAQPGKIALMGGGFGGFATLAGLAFTPETYACGISMSGPSNLISMMENLPPRFRAANQMFLHRVGDPSSESGRAALAAQSPALHAENIRAPLLISQGGQNPLISEDDTEFIVDTMRRNDVPVTYIFMPDEGNFIARPQNRLAFYGMAENFLADCLGGRAEPLGNALSGSSVQIIEGVDHIPGLIEAMALTNQTAP